MVESEGIEPASVSPLPIALHAYLWVHIAIKVSLCVTHCVTVKSVIQGITLGSLPGKINPTPN